MHQRLPHDLLGYAEEVHVSAAALPVLTFSRGRYCPMRALMASTSPR